MSHATMYQFENKPPRQNIQTDIDRLRTLVQDLERARDGKHPSRSVINHAPVLEDWQFFYREEVCLAGTVTGHPEIGDGRQNRTSGLWLISRKHGYARTLSRFYALGHQTDDPHFRL